MKVKEIQYIDSNLFAPKDAWDALSMREKAEMMRVAVRNGITNLQEIRQEYNEFAEGGDTENDDYYATMEKVAEENYKNWGFNNPDEALVHALNDYTYDYRGYYQKYPQSRANADTHWTDEFKTVYHPTFSNESRYSGQKSIYNPLGLPGGFWVGETFVPRAWQVVEANKFTEGGGIHIKPENRGKFTALKERTGHSASWFKEHGTPAQKKMATFALNARKWKHGDGGNLYGGESEDTQQMQIGREYWQQQTSQPTLEQALAEFNRQKEIERQQKAAALREQIAAKGRAIAEQRLRDSQVEQNDNAWVDYSFTVKKPKNPHLHDRAVEGAKAHAAWEKEHPNLTAWGNVLGAAPFAVAAYPLASTIGSGLAAIGDAAAATTAGQGLTNFLTPIATSTIAGAPALEWANIGLSSLSAAHGASQAIEDGGISPMTALEMTPALQVAKPMVNEAALTVENYRYPLGRPQVPEGYSTIKPQVRTRVGDVETDNPNLLYHLDRGDGSGAFSNQGAYVVDGLLFPGTPKNVSAVPYSWWNKGKPYATHVGEQPMTRLMTATEDSPGMTHVRSQNYPIGQWNGRKGFVLDSEYVNPEGVDVSGSMFNWEPEYGWRRVFAENTPAAEWAELTKPTYKSELDWSPESWFGTRATGIYDAEDVAALQSHLPEYIEIERTAKANGTWLKMPDGSTWQGDPRGWIMLQSKAVQKHNPFVFKTGVRTPAVNPEYNGDLWGVFGEGKKPETKARTYAFNDDNVLTMFTDSKVPIEDIDAEGRHWGNVLKGITSDMYVDDAFSRGTKLVKIRNVQDTGPNAVPTYSIYYSKDYLNPFVPQNDVIIPKGQYRKSIFGNNGDFAHPTNIYKGLIPGLFVSPFLYDK